MREVFTNPDFTRVGYYKSILDEAGISSFVRNENSIGAVGAAFPPSLCVTDDATYDEAIRLIQSREFIGSADEADWLCAACAEPNPGNFELCWNCNSPRPGT